MDEQNTHIQRALDRFEAIQQGEQKLSYTFGWGPDVDNRILGLEPEQLVVVGGPNKSGKSIHGLNTVYHNIRAGHKVLYFPTEMSGAAIVSRLVCRKLGIELRDYKTKGALTPEQQQSVLREIKNLQQAPLVIVDDPYPDYEMVEGFVQKHSPEIVVIDHFQRMNPGNKSLPEGYRDLAQKLKHLAMTYKVPVLVMSQVNYADGWCELKEDGSFDYTIQLMNTRWTNELHGEADKVLYLHNVGRDYPMYKGQGHIIYHSIRDYDADGYSRVNLDFNRLYVGPRWKQEIGTDEPL